MKIVHNIIIFTILSGVAWSCQSEPRVLTEEEKENYKEEGQQISQATFKELSTHLHKALDTKGVTAAIQYCSLRAYPLTDSLSEIHQVDIRRTAMQYRNPENKPNEQELKILGEYEKAVKNREQPKAIIQLNDDEEAVYFAPIMTMPLCLKCHGEIGTDIKDEDYQAILENYPDDKATGFKIGELRGIWSLTFQDKDEK